MALQKFTHQIIKGQNIKIFNHGNHKRDFTYIDDIVEGVIRVLDKVATSNPDWNSDFPDSSTSNAPWRIYNIGNTQPIKLMNYIEAIEKALKKKANKQLLPIQQGDVPNTWANVEELKREFNYQPNTTIEEGINKFVEWFRDYYKI
jgi:UDP-glucuronate 4-epimerase